MKKQLACAFAAVLVLTNITGCNNDQTSQSGSDPANIESQTERPVRSEPDGSESLESYVPEEKKPDGEPTFLTAPDGTPIYTSEITKYQNPAEFHGTHEQYPLDQLNKETFSSREILCDYPEIVCEGFAYAFVPRINICCYGSPEKFRDQNGIMIYDDDGEEFPGGGDYFKLNVGDKFGGLTVKKASTTFSYINAAYIEDAYSGDLDGIPGIYLSKAEIRYEGTVEMTGYLEIREDEGYSTSGDMHFYPDSESAARLPNVYYSFDSEHPERGVFHEPFHSSDGYGEIGDIFLGNMNDCENVDFSGLQPGDNAHVKLTVKDPGIFLGSGFGKLAGIEILEMLER